MTNDENQKPVLSRRHRVLKRIRNITISTVVILLVLVGAGALYTWYMGKQQVPQQATVVSKPREINPIKAPTVPPDAKVSISTQSVVSTVRPGENASITVRTNPNASCVITVTYGEVDEEEKRSTDSGLVKKVSDEFGMVSWAWTVEDVRPVGTWPIEVTCANEKNSAYLKADLIVKAS